MLKRVLAAIMFAAAAVLLGVAVYYGAKYHKADKEYDSIREHVVKAENNADGDEDTRMVVDWDDLISQNSDYVGWIEMATGASYPIVRAKDNDYYLHRGFNREYSINGSIFMSCYCDKNFNSKNTVIYGHNMLNGSMFGTNKKYRDYDYAEENPYFYIHVKGGYYVYEVYTYILTDDVTAPYNTDVYTEEDMAKYLKEVKPLGQYWINSAAPTEKDKIVTLSTCIGQAGGIHRQIIQGKYAGFIKYKNIGGKNGEKSGTDA